MHGGQEKHLERILSKKTLEKKGEEGMHCKATDLHISKHELDEEIQQIYRKSNNSMQLGG